MALHTNPKLRLNHPIHIETIGEALAAPFVGDLALIREDILTSLEPSSRPELGEVALKTFKLSKRFGKKPPEIADLIVRAAKQRPDLFHDVNVALPYVNFRLNYGYYDKILSSLDHHVDQLTDVQDDVVVIEHTQPNTHKELHVGHLRNTILGDAIYRLARPYYRRVYAVDYHGDEGVHVARTIWYIKKHNLWPAENIDRGAWLGEIYPLAVAEVESAKGTAGERQSYNEVSEILRNIESRQGRDFELWQETRAWSLASFKNIYGWLDAHFDKYYSESYVSEASQRRVDEYLAKGVFVKSEGAIGCDLSEFDLGFCMLRKSDGSGLYATKDVELAIERERDFGFNTCIYVVDIRQRFHFQQVFHTLKKMGFSFADYCVHLAYDIVQTKEGTISSRRGARYSAQEITKELEQAALGNIQSRWKDSVSAEEAGFMAHAIALSAMRYGMLKVDPEKKITFDLKEWLSPEGNTGPYLLYTYARVASLLRRAEVGAEPVLEASFARLRDPREAGILGRILELPIMLRDATARLKPNMVCNHAHDVAQLFNSFYNQIPILSDEDSEVRYARLALSFAVKRYFEIVFERLGIVPIERV